MPELNSPDCLETLQLNNHLEDHTFIIFLHIQKTAGMTLQRYLRKQFGPAYFTRILWRLKKDQRLSPSIVDAAMARVRSDKFFAGHFCFGMHRHLPVPASYMTFLRDPITRCLSLYKYSRSNPSAYYHRQALEHDLNGFMQKTKLLELDNGMVRFLAGSEEDYFINRTPFGECSEELLEKAKSNVERFFFFVGIQERFDESMLLLGHLIGDPKPRYISLNRSKPSSRLQIDTEVRRMIIEQNKYDQELYAWASEHFNEQLNTEFKDVDSQLARLRSRNQRYTQAMKVPHKISAALRPTAP